MINGVNENCTLETFRWPTATQILISVLQSHFWSCMGSHMSLLPGKVLVFEYGHYSDVIMSVMTSQITDAPIVYSTVCTGADQRKHQSSARHWPLCWNIRETCCFVLEWSLKVLKIWFTGSCRNPEIYNHDIFVNKTHNSFIVCILALFIDFR